MVCQVSSAAACAVPVICGAVQGGCSLAPDACSRGIEQELCYMGILPPGPPGQSDVLNLTTCAGQKAQPQSPPLTGGTNGLQPLPQRPLQHLAPTQAGLPVRLINTP